MNRHIKILYYLTKRTLKINLFILYKIKLTFGEVKGVFTVILVVRRQKPEKNISLWLPGSFPYILLPIQGQNG